MHHDLFRDLILHLGRKGFRTQLYKIRQVQGFAKNPNEHNPRDYTFIGRKFVSPFSDSESLGSVTRARPQSLAQSESFNSPPVTIANKVAITVHATLSTGRGQCCERCPASFIGPAAGNRLSARASASFVALASCGSHNGDAAVLSMLSQLASARRHVEATCSLSTRLGLSETWRRFRLPTAGDSDSDLSLRLSRPASWRRSRPRPGVMRPGVVATQSVPLLYWQMPVCSISKPTYHYNTIITF